MVVVTLLMPIMATTVALFFASFLSWMVLPLHSKDWRKSPGEDQLLEALRAAGVPPGNYFLPGAETNAERQSPEFQAKLAQGPLGVLTIFPRGPVNMGRNLALTILYFFVCSACLAYLGRLGLGDGAGFLAVFRFMSTAALLTYLPAILSHAIWFHCRVVGHVVESIAYALITGAIFAALWP